MVGGCSDGVGGSVKGERNWHCHDVNCDCASFLWAWMLPVQSGKFRRCPYCNRQLGDMSLRRYRLVRARSFSEALVKYKGYINAL